MGHFSNKLLIFLGLGLILFSSCNRKTAKSTVEDLGSTTNFTKLVIKSNNRVLSPDWMMAKADIDLELPQFDTRLKSRILLQKDQRIMITASKFGAELLRAYASRDTVIVLDRFRKKFIMLEGDKLKSSTIPFKFEILQSLILGKCYFTEIDSFQYEKDSSFLQTSLESFDMTYHFDQEFKLDKGLFQNEQGDQKVNSDWTDYRSIDDKIFSYFRKVEWLENNIQQAKATLEFKDIEINKSYDFKVNIPASYTEWNPK